VGRGYKANTYFALLWSGTAESCVDITPPGWDVPFFGAVVGCLVGFFGLYGICWTISWLAGNWEYKHLMWVGVVIVLVGGGTFALVWAGGRIESSLPRGFDVNHTGSDNAG